MDNFKLSPQISDYVIEGALPEHFQTEYPQLISFLKSYYDHLDSDLKGNSIADSIRQKYNIDVVDSDLFDSILFEIGNGLKSNTLSFPKTTIKNFPDYWRIKGTEYSIQTFFRALYDESVEISYPKNDIFIVGESNIGVNSLKFIQNNRLYQIFSILLKTPISSNIWVKTYKEIVHPSGFYLGSEVAIERVVNLSLDQMPISIPDENSNNITVSELTQLSILPYTEIYGEYYEAITDSTYEIIPISIRDIGPTFTVENFQSEYSTLLDVIDGNTTATFDDSDSTGKFDGTISKFDEDL